MKTTGKYILNGHDPTPCDDLLDWGGWMEKGDRIVKQETVNGTWISTVFLGIDHQYGGGPPLLFETMTRRPDGTWDRQERCSTWEEAESQHAAMVQEVSSIRG